MALLFVDPTNAYMPAVVCHHEGCTCLMVFRADLHITRCM